MAQKLFSDADFDKQLNLGDVLTFDKQGLTKLRIELNWTATDQERGQDLDLGAFLLGSDNMIHDRDDLVYYNSHRRWLTEKPFSDPDFDPLKGRVSKWEDDATLFKGRPKKWQDSTLPLSSDNSVIGSWDDMAEDESLDCGEVMHVVLDEVNAVKYPTIVFAAAVAPKRMEAGDTFKDSKEPVVTIYNAENDEVVAEYKLANDFPDMDAVCFAKMTFDSKSFLWSFETMGEGYKGGFPYLATEVYN
jgi:stress response protein SCP2